MLARNARSLRRLFHSSVPRAQWQEVARQWVDWDPNPETKAEIEALLESGDMSKLEDKFNSRIEFGTAGLRGVMEAGPLAMNDLVVIQSTQGLCQYLESQFGEELKKMGVAIGFDHRARGSLNSEQFARLASAVFLSNGVPVYLLTGQVATPFVPVTMLNVKVMAKIAFLTAVSFPSFVLTPKAVLLVSW
jgi:hypothetical protein